MGPNGSENFRTLVLLEIAARVFKRVLNFLSDRASLWQIKVKTGGGGCTILLGMVISAAQENQTPPNGRQLFLQSFKKEFVCLSVTAQKC